MKIGKMSVEVKARVTVVKTSYPELLGMTGYIVVSNCRNAAADLILDSTCNRVHLYDADVVVEIPEQDGILAGETNIPVNERVKVLSSNDAALVDMVGFITHPFPGPMVPSTHYIAGIWIEGNSPYGSKRNLRQGDVVFRYPQEVL